MGTEHPLGECCQRQLGYVRAHPGCSRAEPRVERKWACMEALLAAGLIQTRGTPLRWWGYEHYAL